MPKSPIWISPPEQKWLDCVVEGWLEPEGYAVQIRVNGHNVAAVVPGTTIDLKQQKPPTNGKIKVVVLAHLTETEDLAELPTPPVNGTQRITVQRERLTD